MEVSINGDIPIAGWLIENGTSFLIGELFAQQTLLAVQSAGRPIGHVHALGGVNQA